MAFYDISNLLNIEAKYYIAFGERSAGKSFSTCVEAIKDIVKSNYKNTMVILRRREEDIRGDRSSTYFNALVSSDKIKELTNGQYDGVYYHARKYYFSKTNEETASIIKSEQPFAYIYSLGAWEHNKGTNIPEATFILYEEFISFDYLPDEETYFLNCLSTIIRHRDNVKVVLLGNAINKYANPMFRMMDIEKVVKAMEPGQIQVIENKRTGLRIAVEYTESAAGGEGKPSDIYFSFSDHSSASSITTGEWQTSNFPHLPIGTKLKREDIIFTYFINAYDVIIQCDIYLNNNYFCFFHEKTTPIKDWDNDLVFQLEYDLRPNIRRDFTHPTDKLHKKILDLFLSDKCYYSSNDVGEVVNAFVKESGL